MTEETVVPLDAVNLMENSGRMILLESLALYVQKHHYESIPSKYYGLLDELLEEDDE